MVEEKVKSSGLKKKKTKPLPIALEELEISQDDVLCGPEFIFEAIHGDQSIPMNKPAKKSSSMKKKKVEPLKLYDDDLALYPTDVLIVPHSVLDTFQQDELFAPKVKFEEYLLQKEHRLIMRNGRVWEKGRNSRKFFKKGPRPKVWKVPGLIRGPLHHLPLTKLPRYWHKFEQPHAKIRHHTTMPTETYHSLFLNNDTTTPVHFINSATRLLKPQGTSKPTISMLWTKGPTPQIIDYSVFNHSQFGGQLKKESDIRRRLSTESDLAKRGAYTALYLGVKAKLAVSQSLDHLVRWSFAIGRWARSGLLRLHFKIRYQFIPVAIFSTRQFLRAHIDFIYLVLHSSAHVVRWAKRNLRPLTL